jgi:hypothetical protein
LEEKRLKIFTAQARMKIKRKAIFYNSEPISLTAKISVKMLLFQQSQTAK